MGAVEIDGMTDLFLKLFVIGSVFLSEVTELIVSGALFQTANGKDI